MKSSFSLLRLAALLLLFTPLPGAYGADPSPPGGGAGVTVAPETLQQKIKETEAATALDEATKKKLIELYQKALGYQDQASANNKTAETYRKARETAAAEAEAVRKEMERAQQTSPTAELNVSYRTPLGDIEQLLVKEKADLAAVEAKLSELEQALTRESDRPGKARERLTVAKQRQERIAGELGLASTAGEKTALSEAGQWLLQSENLALSAEIQMLDQELLSQPMRLELLKAQRDRNANSIEWIEERVAFLETLASARRVAEAEQAKTEAEEAKLEAMGKHPLIRQLAEQNAALSEEVSTLATALEEVTAQEDAAKKQAKAIGDHFRSTQQKMEVAGLSQALGQLLLEQRRRLPNPGQFRKEAGAREQQIADAGLRQIQHEEERRQLRNIDAYIDTLTSELGEDERQELDSELRSLVDSRRELVEQAITIDQTYLRALGELDFAQRQLLDTVEAYNAFLNEHLLWVRSSAEPSIPMLLALPEQVAGLLSPEHWIDVIKVVAVRATQSPILVLALILFAVLLWKAGGFRAALREQSKFIGRPSKDSFSFTFKALALTLVLTIPWPLLLAATGWEIARSVEATVFAKSVSRGLIWVAEAFFYLQFFYVLCERGGLATAHFRWPEPTVQVLHRALGRLMLVFLPAAFVAMVVITYETATLGGALGRLAFVVVVLSLAAFFYQLFRPLRGALHPYMAKHPRTLLARFRRLWLALTVALPLGLAGLAIIGYLYTAGTLTGRFIETLWFVLVLIVVHQMVIRWLTVVRRRLALQAALERREAARAAAESEEEPEARGEEGFEAVEEPEIDLVALSEESRQLLRTTLIVIGIVGIWLIWSKVLPAFGLLDQITLWHHLGTVDGKEQAIPVTLADAALAVLIIAITVVATKRFPALLEIGLLQRLEMTSGGRYAATSLSRYVIVAGGALLAFNTVGASWSQVQWLVAALGVGIGFGLQEIVANFISGLIILFERPIRVGDVVTVGDTDGVVSRIQIRATTIRRWDRKELLVPNKEFITGRLLNWSLSDQTARILIPVGLAYGGDVQKALALMLEAAEEHDRILEDPPPFTSFEGFGDNALALNLRCYIGSLDYRLATISELHQAINEKFAKAGLVIAFPQRDVHLDTDRPLDIRIRRDKDDSAKGED